MIYKGSEIRFKCFSNVPLKHFRGIGKGAAVLLELKAINYLFTALKKIHLK